MKRLLLSSVILLFFAISILLFQISCTKTVDAQAKEGATVSNMAKLKEKPLGETSTHKEFYLIMGHVNGGSTAYVVSYQDTYFYDAINPQTVHFTTLEDAEAFVNTISPTDENLVGTAYNIQRIFIPKAWNW